MISRKIQWTLFLFSLTIVEAKLPAEDQQVVKLVASTIIEVDLIEKTLIKEQVELKTYLKLVLNSTTVTRSKLSLNKRLQQFKPLLASISGILTKLHGMTNVTLSNLHRLSGSACHKINLMVPRLEQEMAFLLKIHNNSDHRTSSLAGLADDLNSEYSKCRSFLNKDENSTTLNAIALLKNVINKSHNFNEELKFSAVEVSNTLFGIKLIRARKCNPQTKKTTTVKVSASAKTTKKQKVGTTSRTVTTKGKTQKAATKASTAILKTTKKPTKKS